jgi:putative membrane protein
VIVATEGSLLSLLGWQRRRIAYFAICAAAVLLVREMGWDWVELHPTPVTILGGALAIFAGFRTNSAYDRWWEGRRLWGALVNSSRMFATQVTTYLPGEDDGPSALQRRLLHRHIGYIHVLRCALRDLDVFGDERVKRFLDGELEALRKERTPAHALLDRTLKELTLEAREGRLEELRLSSLDRTLAALLDAQGGCERLKKTPMPRAYGFIADRIITLYGLLLPLALTGDLWVWMIPVNIVVCTSFLLISEVGRVLEDPFTLFYNAVPLQAISQGIENDVRHRLGDSALDPVPGPVDGILM